MTMYEAVGELEKVINERSLKNTYEDYEFEGICFIIEDGRIKRLAREVRNDETN